MGAPDGSFLPYHAIVQKSVSPKKVIWVCKIGITVLRRNVPRNVKPDYMRTDLPTVSIRTKLARFMLIGDFARWNTPLAGSGRLRADGEIR
jgi:hypothetical protein